MKNILIMVLVSFLYLENGFAQIDTTNSYCKFSVGIAPIRILNNKFSIISQFTCKRNIFSSIVDFQIKYIPFKKPLILDYNDFNQYIKLTLIYERKIWTNQKQNIGIGIAPTLCANYTYRKQTGSALVTNNSSATSNIYDEKNLYYGILSNFSYSLNINKKMYFKFIAQAGPVKDKIERTNIINPFNGDKYNNVLIYKTKFNYELLASINYYI
jgi:hypothetical protein